MPVHVLSPDPLLEKNVNVKTPKSSLKYQKLNPQVQVQSKMMLTVASSQKVNTPSTVNKSISPSPKPNMVTEEKGKSAIRNKKSLNAINFIVPLQVNGYPINSVVDSAAQVTVMSEKLANQFVPPPQRL